jgi:hypothetical protein
LGTTREGGSLVENLKAILKDQTLYILPADTVIAEKVMWNKPDTRDVRLHDMCVTRLKEHRG